MDKRDGDTLGGRIQRGRETLGLSTRELAAKLGVTSETLRGWERDQAEPRANRLIMLSGLLGVSPAWLIGGYGEGPEDFELNGPAIEAKLRFLIERREVLNGEIARLQALQTEAAAG